MWRLCGAALLICASLCSCSRQEKFVEQRMQMATVTEIQVLAPARDEARARAAMQSAFAAIDAVEANLSWFKPDSDPARIRRAQPGEVVKVSPWTFQSLELARSITKLTDGIYDVCAGPIIRLWGFGPGKTNRVPTDAELAAALLRTGMDKLVLLGAQQAVSSVVAGVDVDLSSLAAGFAVDRAAEALLAAGYSNFLVNGGGEIRTSSLGRKVWRIGVQVPTEDSAPGEYMQDRVLKLRTASISTSGSYRNFYKAGTSTYAHIVNPKTGRPLRSDTVSVTTWAENCTLADAWSTALFAVPVERAIELANRLPEVECLVVQHPASGNKSFRFLYSDAFRRETE